MPLLTYGLAASPVGPLAVGIRNCVLGTFERPVHGDSTCATANFYANVRRIGISPDLCETWLRYVIGDGCCLQLQWYECAGGKLGLRDHGALVYFSYPAMHYVRIDVVAQGHAGNRRASLAALLQHLCLELSAVKIGRASCRE